jgi:hypothetical protein
MLAEHYYDDIDDKDRVEAEHAIRHIGNKGIPYLLKWIQSDPPTDGIFRHMACMVIAHLHLSWQLPADRHFSRDSTAPFALAVLGSKAETTVPELTKLLNDKRRPQNAERAAKALRHLGDLGLPPLLSILTNRTADLRLREYVALERHGISNPETTSPALEHLLTHPDPTVRLRATNSLREIAPGALEDGTVSRGKSWRLFD